MGGRDGEGAAGRGAAGAEGALGADAYAVRVGVGGHQVDGTVPGMSGDDVAQWLRAGATGVGGVLLGLALSQVWWGWPGEAVVTGLAVGFFVLGGGWILLELTSIPRMTRTIQALEDERVAAGGWERMSEEQRADWTRRMAAAVRGRQKPGAGQ